MIEKICTIGPSSNNKTVISELISNGMTIVRLNLSHGNYQTHLEVINIVKSLRKEKGIYIKILGDLQGPKIRLGSIENEEVSLKQGANFLIRSREIKGNQYQASVDYNGLVNDVKVGSRVLINDGEVELTVTAIDNENITTIVKVGGTISSRKGVNVPGTTLSLPAITDKDKRDIQFLLDNHVDIIACSFIRKPVHLQYIREYISEFTNTPPKIMAKIETLESIQQFIDICEASDAIMIARGDLGVELPYYWIPLIQKAIINECNKRGKFVVTATQMLQSMTEHSVPTRAEITDVFQSVLDGTNAVMLSAESASGAHPSESIKILNEVSNFTEIVRKYAPYDFTDMLRLINKELS